MIAEQMPRENNGALGSPEIDEIRWKKPVFPGDVLCMRSTILNKKYSKSRVDMGTIIMQR